MKCMSFFSQIQLQCAPLCPINMYSLHNVHYMSITPLLSNKAIVSIFHWAIKFTEYNKLFMEKKNRARVVPMLRSG